jgi:hypothetical protein
MTRNDVIALLSTIAGVCGLASAAGFSASIDAVAPGWGVKTVAVLGIVGLVVGQVLRTLSNPSPPPGTASVVTASNNATPVQTANANVPTVPIAPKGNAP